MQQFKTLKLEKNTKNLFKSGSEKTIAFFTSIIYKAGITNNVDLQMLQELKKKTMILLPFCSIVFSF